MRSVSDEINHGETEEEPHCSVLKAQPTKATAVQQNYIKIQEKLPPPNARAKALSMIYLLHPSRQLILREELPTPRKPMEGHTAQCSLPLAVTRMPMLWRTSLYLCVDTLSPSRCAYVHRKTSTAALVKGQKNRGATSQSVSYHSQLSPLTVSSGGTVHLERLCPNVRPGKHQQ